MDCTVWITTLRDGERSVFHAVGAFYVSSKFSLFYSDNGDNVQLTYEDDTLRMKRTGEFLLDMVFCAGKRTACVFTFGERKGEAVIQTRSCLFQPVSDRFSIDLSYTLQFEGFSSDFRLKIQIIPRERT